MNRIGIVILSLCAVAVAGCGPTQTAFDYGRIEDGVYTNSYFGFSLAIPDQMTAMGRQQMDQLASELRRGSSPGRTASEGAELLLFLSRYEMSQPAGGAFNYSLSATAERLGSRSAIETNEQYAAAAMEAVAASGIGQGDAPLESRRAILGGRDFVKFTMALQGGAAQDIYVHVQKPYALVFTATYDRGQQGAVDSLLNRITFK